jgi:predicted RNA-binding protein YlxR (DUF448 family)
MAAARANIRSYYCNEPLVTGKTCAAVVSKEGEICNFHRRMQSGQIYRCDVENIMGRPCERFVSKRGDVCAQHRPESVLERENQLFTCGSMIEGAKCERPVPAQNMRCRLHKDNTAPSETVIPNHRLSVLNNIPAQQDKNPTNPTSTNSMNSPMTTFSKACCFCHEVLKKPTETTTSEETYIRCSKCLRFMHPSCVNMSSRMAKKVLEYPWDCYDCKTCIVCQELGEEDKLLFCDECDRGYHTYCLDKKLQELPEGRWICSNCELCHDCGKKKPGTRNDSQWHHIFSDENEKNSTMVAGLFLITLCEQCFSRFQEYRYCPICLHTYDEKQEDELLYCKNCHRYLHVSCQSSSISKEKTGTICCSLCAGKMLKQKLTMLNGKKIAIPFASSC